MMPTEVYVSITGLQVRQGWQTPTFWYHAMRAMAQARSAAGNISAEARSINGVHHTLSVWASQSAMRAYLTEGAHLDAMRVFPKIATGKTVGFLTSNVPDWSQVHSIWVEQGRVV